MEETPHTDPVQIRRVYRFQFSRGQLAIGRHGGAFILRTRCNPPAMASTLPLEIEVLDRVAIMPNPLAIVAEAGKSEESRIFVVRRAGGGKVEATQWDRRLLDVHPLAGNGDRTAAFAVVLKTLSKVARETTIVFEVGCGETRLATVRISPPGSLPRSM